MCKDALASSGQPDAQRAFALSIAGLMLVPALLVGGVTTWVVRAARQHRRQDASIR